MIDVQQAQKIAKAFLDGLGCAPEDELVINETMTTEKPWGWIFFWDSYLWKEKHLARYAWLGTGPIAVDRETGRVEPIGGAENEEVMVGYYEQRQYGKRFE